MTFPRFTSSAKTIEHIGAWLAFAGALIVYCLTLDPAASWWDCPEYILTAARLEIGHSPGNPGWTLISNVIASIASAIKGPEAIAPALNLSSAIFTAGAVALLFRICYVTVRYAFSGRRVSRPLPAALSALSASLIFAWSDSPWFSAVETEVYALSLFFTALTVWLMLRWAATSGGIRADKYLILIAYITGFSIGVHELNLLVIPTLALIFIFRRKEGKSTRLAWLALMASIGAIAIILLFWYPGTTMMAGLFELAAVNYLNLPFHSGVGIYMAALLVAGFAAPMLSWWRKRKTHDWIPAGCRALSIFVLLFLSGTFLAGTHFRASAAMSAAAALLLAFIAGHHPRRIGVALWMASFCLVGFSSYLLIPIRSAANPPINENAPSDVFAFLGYLKRDQYGKHPLIYGTTPYAKPMYREKIAADGSPSYTEIAKTPGRPIYRPALKDARLAYRSGLIDSAERAANARLLESAASGTDRYLLSDRQYDVVYTPELNMLFPRLTSHSDFDIKNYESWAGMTKDNMTEVEVSYALDSLGNPVPRMNADGKRSVEKSYRPTLLQNMQELFGYQIGYMYFRYLLWNFCGRQNDYPSAGEIEHGNFITGIPPLDNLMLGNQENLPAEIGPDNIGRNRYFMLPFLLGLTGAIAIALLGRRGKRADAVILSLFLFTGMAIVVYLNQNPGEPRERDYSFMGSFMAFAIWIACGLAWIIHKALELKSKQRKTLYRLVAGVALLLTVGVPAMMLAVNYADHDRSRRNGPADYAANLLNSLDKDAILFVDGDNYTFPVWYAQEVLGIRRDVSVINMSYLLTPWYVEQLMIKGEESRPIPFTATPAMVRYNALNVARVPYDADSGISSDALAALKEAYASTDATKRLPHALLRLPRLNGDSAIFDITKAMEGRSHIALRELAMLDIIATNANSESPRPIYWQNALVNRQMIGLQPLSSRSLYTRKLNLDAPGGYLTEEAMAFLPSIKFGGADRNIYADPYVGDQITRQRVNLLRLAKALIEEHRYAEALDVATMIYTRFPEKVWPYQGVVPHTGDVWQEGLELADIFMTCGEKLNLPQVTDTGRQLHDSQLKRLQTWERWYNSLPEWQKATVSVESRRLANFRQYLDPEKNPGK